MPKQCGLYQRVILVIAKRLSRIHLIHPYPNDSAILDVLSNFSGFVRDG